MPRIYLNNFETTIAAAITTTAQTSVALATGLGAAFTAAGVDALNYIRCTLVNGSTYEDIDVIGISTDTITFRRGAGGTTAATFPSGAAIGCYVTFDSFSTSVPPFLDRNVGWWSVGSGTAIGSAGMTPTTAATLSTPTPASTTLAESCRRQRFACSTTAGNAAGARDPFASFWRGGAAGRGGFDCSFRFHTGSIALSGGQIIVGLASSVTALAGEPSALVDVLGVTKDAADTNLFFSRRTASGTVVKVDLGVAYAANLTFDVRISSLPNGSGYLCKVTQWDFAGVPTVLLNTTYTTSIPAATTFLGRNLQVRNGTTAAANNIEMGMCPYSSAF